MPSPRRIVIAFAVGVLVFAIALGVPRSLAVDGPARLALTQFLEVSLALLAIATVGGGFRACGFRLPTSEHGLVRRAIRWLPIAALALALGAVTTFVMLASGAGGNPVIRQLGFLQIVALVWVSSSVVEEVFVRGFVQSYLAQGLEASPLGAPTVLAAVFFAAMHLSLLFAGVDAVSMVILLAFTLAVGLLAGHQRAASDSLVPAIGAHALANAGGVFGAIAWTVLSLAMGWPVPAG